MRLQPTLPRTASFWIIPAVLLLLAGTPARAEEPTKKYEVKAIRDLDYHEGEDADPIKHKLDLFLPKDAKEFPVVFFVHGGAWRSGDKNFFGLYSSVGRLFARHGVGAVVTNYRLSPSVKHPTHIQDVARAFAWAHKHIGEYGGRKDQMFVCGHSAGGHLVSLLATDDSYLKAHGLTLSAIKGAMPLSGVYRIPDKLFGSVFGSDAAVCKKASPLSHCRPDAPPFLIMWADSDFPTCNLVSEEFCKALKDCKCDAQSLEIKDRNHATIILRACFDDDPCAKAMLQFIQACCGKTK